MRTKIGIRMRRVIDLLLAAVANRENVTEEVLPFRVRDDGMRTLGA